MNIDLVYAVLRALTDRGVRFKVVGGLAQNLVGLPRATQDLDVFIDRRIAPTPTASANTSTWRSSRAHPQVPRAAGRG